MGRKSVVRSVQEWLEEIIAGTEYELVDLEYVKESQGRVLRVFVDKPGGITVEDCQTISLALGERLDQEDPIADSYSLEVSSPGLERPLKKPADYERFAGRCIQLRTYRGWAGRKRFSGILRGLQDQHVLLEWEGEILEIPLELVAKANLALEF